MGSNPVEHRRTTSDPLTGVNNRVMFMDRLHQALRRLHRRDGLVVVLFLDLDRFNLINGSVGHSTGDAVLRQMAERLRGLLRPQDTLARLSGDEFAIVVDDMTWMEQAVTLGTRIVAAARTPFDVDDEQFVCTTSVGIAVTADSHRRPEDLLQEADLALSRAKDSGRDRFELFDEDLRTRALGRLGTERMLRRAIDQHGLRIAFQPIVDLRTSRTVAAEALVRVSDPDHVDLVQAEAFIEVAEETGMLSEMDDWMLSQSIDQATTWRDLFTGTGFGEIAINVTARHLTDPGFAQSVLDDLVAHNLSTRALRIEVTERILLEASTAANAGLKVLRDAGVQVGLDDFGTGYSSLSYLRLFSLDFVKIDRSFIHGLATCGTSRAIVASVIDLSHNLGMSVIAEGVETQRQLDVLVRLGCDRAQGYLFAAAGPPDDIEDRVLRRDVPGLISAGRAAAGRPFAVQEQVEQLADGALPADRVPQDEVFLDLVAVPAAGAFLDDVAGGREVGDDPEGGALGDVHRGGKISQSSIGLGGDEQDRPSVSGEKAPVAHIFRVRHY
jgi:diguanylate cyclase (GGDEF)-like protein